MATSGPQYLWQALVPAAVVPVRFAPLSYPPRNSRRTVRNPAFVHRTFYKSCDNLPGRLLDGRMLCFDMILGGALFPPEFHTRPVANRHTAILLLVIIIPVRPSFVDDSCGPCYTFTTHTIKVHTKKRGNPLSLDKISYSITLVTTPEPTVLPPSRIAKRRPSSIAIGVMSLISIETWSPGMTISVPSGSVMLPVTSVVLK